MGKTIRKGGKEKNPIGQSFGSLGGQATKKKGRTYYQKIANARWAKEGKKK